MDDRIRDHAELLVDWSARVDRGDNVVVSVDDGTHDLAVAIAQVLGERGANVVPTYNSAEVSRAFLCGHSGAGCAGDEDDGGSHDDDGAPNGADSEFDSDPAHELKLIENADVYLRLSGGRNTAATADVPSATRQAYRRSRTGIREARMETDWVSTVHPTRSLAQQAGMSIEAYRDFVYRAILRDWQALADEMDQLKTILDGGSTVHIETAETDLWLSIENRTAVNSAASVAYDSHNLPSGEVFTAPADAEGTVLFDVPMTVDGRRLRNVRLVFENGEVVDYDADQGESVLASILETDDGARRLGELGVGMNRGIDRITDTILFDEKMGDTVHLALGRAYDACLPDGETGNQSAVHVDLIADMSTDSRLSVDGETVQRNGVFRWESGFSP